MSKMQKVMCQNFTFVSTFLVTWIWIIQVYVGWRRCRWFPSLWFIFVVVFCWCRCGCLTSLWLVDVALWLADVVGWLWCCWLTLMSLAGGYIVGWRCLCWSTSLAWKKHSPSIFHIEVANIIKLIQYFFAYWYGFPLVPEGLHCQDDRVPHPFGKSR